MWSLRGVCDECWSTFWLLWVRRSVSRKIDRSKFRGHANSTRWPQEVVLRMMSHLGGFHIQKAIIITCPNPFGRRLPVFLGNLSSLILKILKKVWEPSRGNLQRYDLPLLVLTFSDDPPLWGLTPSSLRKNLISVKDWKRSITTIQNPQLSTESLFLHVVFKQFFFSFLNSFQNVIRCLLSDVFFYLINLTLW